MARLLTIGMGFSVSKNLNLRKSCHKQDPQKESGLFLTFHTLRRCMYDPITFLLKQLAMTHWKLLLDLGSEEIQSMGR